MCKIRIHLPGKDSRSENMSILKQTAIANGNDESVIPSSFYLLPYQNVIISCPRRQIAEPSTILLNS